MAQTDTLKRYLDAGIAFTAMTQSRAEAIVKDLVKTGEVQSDAAQAVVLDLVDRLPVDHDGSHAHRRQLQRRHHADWPAADDDDRVLAGCRHVPQRLAP